MQNDLEEAQMGGFPKIRGTFLGVPIMRFIVFWGLYWGPPILGNYHMGVSQNEVYLFGGLGLRVTFLGG